MIIAIIILNILLVAAGAFIFLLMKVLKNIFTISFSQSKEMLKSELKNFDEAYDNKYYPATIILTTQYNQPNEGIITDFSMYEEKNIIGFTGLIKESFEDYITNSPLSMFIKEIPIELIKEIFNKPTIIKDVIVYSPIEGVWTWKLQ